jgi:hypothetical protein
VSSRAARRSPRAVALGVSLLLGAALLGACGGDDEAAVDDASEATATAAADGSAGPDAEADAEATDAADERDTEETTTTESAGGGDLVGTWVADAGDLLAANTANLGGVPGMDCSGPITLEFAPDGGFAQRGDASCSIGGMTASLNIETTGRYQTSGGTLTVTESSTTGTMEVGGASQPADVGFGEGEGTYEVRGDTLTVTFSDPSVGTVTQTYQRS